MGEAISPPTSKSTSADKQKTGGEAIPVEYYIQLKEDLKLGAEYLLAKKSPREILEDAIKNKEWFKGIVLGCAFFEHYGYLRLKGYFHGVISENKLKNLTLIEILILLFAVNSISQNAYAKMIKVKEKRDDLVHNPFAEVDPKESEQLIRDTLECLSELGAA